MDSYRMVRVRRGLEGIGPLAVSDLTEGGFKESRGLDLVDIIAAGEAVAALAEARVDDMDRAARYRAGLERALALHSPDLKACFVAGDLYGSLRWLPEVTGGHAELRSLVHRILDDGDPLLVGGKLVEKPGYQPKARGERAGAPA